MAAIQVGKEWLISPTRLTIKIILESYRTFNLMKSRRKTNSSLKISHFVRIDPIMFQNALSKAPLGLGVLQIKEYRILTITTSLDPMKEH
jgi:hypothetical protein